MSVTPDKQHSMDLLRAALRETTGDPQADELFRASLRASFGDDPDLVKVYLEETAPVQAELDLRLSGANVTGHATEAKPLGDFLRHASQSVNAIARSISNIKRLGDRLIVEPGPGSVRLTMRAPVEERPQEDVLAEAPTVETMAIDLLASLMNEAESDDLNSPLSGSIQRLSPQARSELRLLARTASRAGWTIDGTVARYGTPVAPVRMTARGAARLELEAEAGNDVHEVATLFGHIDGHVRSEGVIHFIQEGGTKFRAGVTDADLMISVAHLAAEDDLRVKAVFDIYTRTGGDEVLRTSRVLKSIEPAPRAQHESDPPLTH